MKNKKTILIIDDEIEIREDLKAALVIHQFEVLQAENGFQGFEKIIKHNPDIVICDVTMPTMNGLELLSLVRKNDSIANIPFLFLTGKSDYQDIREGMDLGADDYLIKPFDINSLVKAINIRLEKSNIEKSMYESKIEVIKNSIFRSIPHEIRTPINGILNNSDWIIKNSNKMTIDELRENVIDINKYANRLNRLFENYIFIIKLKLLKQNSTDLEDIQKSYTNYPNVIIRDIANLICSKKSTKCVHSVRNDVSKININEHHFTKIIYELVENAHKFSYSNNTVKLNSVSDNNKFYFTITNIGTKFPEDKKSEINDFSQFDRKVNEQGGVGLGLSVVKQILEIYGSELIINTDDEKTEVSFTVNI